MTPDDESPSRPSGPRAAGAPRPDRDDGSRAEAEAHLERRELRTGQRPGTKYVRIERPHAREFRRAPEGHIIATERVLEPRGGFALFWTRLKRLVIGSPLTTAMSVHERIPKIKALAVFSSDAISSSAYATEEILLVLTLAGAAAATSRTMLWITGAIILLLAIVATSYRQTIFAYPGGGGSYIVTRDNLGDIPALLAASSLLTDYVLTVAVSISAGVAAITSAAPGLVAFRVEMAIAFIVFMVVVNLRGVRESATIFMLPTYLFIGSMLLVFGIAAFKYVALGELPRAEAEAVPAVEGMSLFLVLRAFASGCAALTGTEAISDGVPAFKEPQAKNAATTLVWMAAILGVLFGGIGLLAHVYQILPNPDGNPTVISQVVRLTLGTNVLFYLVQAFTTLILVLAANTAFSDFPRLSFFLARDGFLPHQFSFRGDRLSFSTGIVVLGALATILVISFGAETSALIPLYAVGVFVSFTCSQSSMVKRWWTRRSPGWQRSMVINAVGAVTTGLVSIIIAATKFSHGAWMILIIIPVIIATLYAIHRHYEAVAAELVLDPQRDTLELVNTKPLVIVPLPNLHLGVLPALSFARAISDNVTAVHVTDDLEAAERLKQRWEEWGQKLPLVIIESPYRSLLPPLLAYIAARRENEPNRLVTIVLPEFVPKHWWEWILHNQTALRLKAALFFHANVVVADVPYHLKH
ncbi:MAG TPA: APC family permease [Chloroflexota bacterium]|nr:APC family permease [Chloroflexota bacterium]